MFEKFKNKIKNKSNNESDNTDNININQNENANTKLKSSYELRNEIEEKFDGKINFDDLAFSDFTFIYAIVEDLKVAFVVASYIKEIDLNLSEIMEVYNLDIDYIDNVLSENLPKLRVEAHKRLKNAPNEKNVFFPDIKIDNTRRYKEFIDRVEYFFDIRRNTKKVLNEINDSEFAYTLLTNKSFMFLLNYLSLKDALILSLNLNIVDTDEDTINKYFNYNDDDFEKVFNKSITEVKTNLEKQIKKLDIFIKRNEEDVVEYYFDYYGLLNEYKDLLERINDTKDYLNKRVK